jgi:hypothetical protein
MKQRVFGAIVFCTFLAAGAQVMTVTNGQPDSNRHPYVGVVIQPVAGQPGLFSICSGAALSPTKFLTAAHCADPSQPVFVSYKSGPPFSLATDFTPGTFHAHPDWCIGCGPGLQGFDSHDVAVVTLNSPRSPSRFATLPVPGLVDSLRMGTSVDIVGYGVQGFIRGGGPPQQIFTFSRFFAPSQLVQSNNRASVEFIKLTANPSKGTGGTCFGDSGGPDVLSGTDIVLAVNSFVTNGNCAGVTYSNRVDLPDILNFIDGF